jgi:CHAT domain-containing protein/tetratricopeptide (TPR) repeat protein
LSVVDGHHQERTAIAQVTRFGRVHAWLIVVAVCFSGAGSPAQQTSSGALNATSLAARVLSLPRADQRRALLVEHAALVDTSLPRALVDEARRLTDATELAQARMAYAIAIELAAKLGDRVNLASALIGIGSIHGRQGDYPAASAALDAGLLVAEALNDIVRIDAALHNLGVVHRLQGEYEEALGYYRRVVALADATGRAHELGPTFNNIGIVHMLRGSYGAALAALHRSLDLKEASGDRAGLPSTLTNIGIVQVQQGHPELALDYYRRSLEVAESVGQTARRAGTLNDIGQAYAMLDRHDLALDYYRRALEQHQAAGRRAEGAATLYNIGRIEHAAGRLEAAVDYLSQSLATREAINDRPGIAETLVTLGEVALARGDPGAALESTNRATHLASEIGARESFWQGRLVAGRAHQVLGAVAPARVAYEDAIDTIEALRVEVTSAGRDRQRYFERKLEPYHRLVALLVAGHRLEEALAVAERARARVLLEVLRDGPADRRSLTAEERDRERALERQISDLHAALWARQASAQPDPAALARLQNELRAARLAHGELRAAVYAAHPTLRLHRGDTSAGSLAEAAALLTDDRAALLEFVVTEAATYLFVITPSAPSHTSSKVQIAAFELTLTRERLRLLVDRFRRQLERRDLDFRDGARALFDLVLGKAAPVLRDRKNLIVVPDGPLWELPFHALRPGWGGFLIEHASVSLAPSIGVLRELRARRGRPPSTEPPRLLALGDPASQSVAGPADVPGPTLPPLPDAARQVHALARLYGSDRSVVLVGKAASERALRETSAGATVVHVATHGLVDNSSPMYSYLHLTGNAAGEAEADGRLEAWEIADLRLPVEAVVVAACETALGRVGPGEGMIGLSWAFFLAGSPRTVAGLWKVDASSTTDFMLEFHRRFREGLRRDGVRPGAAASLREAALLLIRSERYRHPFYWAGIVIVGDGS